MSEVDEHELGEFDDELYSTDLEIAEEEVDGEPVDDGQEDELEPDGQVAPPRFAYNHRLYAFAYSRSGKSEILNVIFSGIACQRILIDTKPEFAIDGVEPVHDVSQIDWREQTIHYKALPGSDCSQYEDLFEALLTIPGAMTVCVHEIQDLVDYQPQKAGRFLRGYMAKGGALGKGLIAASQRPRLIPSAAISEATHLLILPPQLARKEDMVTAAEVLSPVGGEPFHVEDLARELALLEQQHGRFSFLWKDRLTAILHAFPPLPEAVRQCSIVQRVEDH